MKKPKGEIRIPAGVSIWKHELDTANVLAAAGYVIEFLASRNVQNNKSADIVINGEEWELKAPKSDRLAAIERNLKRATKQSSNIVIDSRRMSKLHDKTIQQFLIQKLQQQKTIKKLLFINRKHELIDINKID